MLFVGCPYCFNAGFLTNEALHNIEENGIANSTCSKCKRNLPIIKNEDGIITAIKEKGEDEIKVKMIACVDKNWGIGYQNKLQFNFPEDKKFFKDMTMGKTVVMGYNTFKSIGKPLDGRRNIVIINDDNMVWTPPENLEYMTIENFEKYIQKNKDELKEIWIIGGEYMYNKFFRRASEFYITQVNAVKAADKHFPNLDFYGGYNKVEVISTGNVDEHITYEISKWENEYPMTIK